MPLDIIKAERKPFDVDAVRVTEDNIKAVASWCRGDVRHSPDDRRPYVKVRVIRPLDDRQTMAFVGDWVLYAGTGYKVYTDAAYNRTFQPKGK